MNREKIKINISLKAALEQIEEIIKMVGCKEDYFKVSDRIITAQLLLNEVNKLLLKSEKEFDLKSNTSEEKIQDILAEMLKLINK